MVLVTLNRTILLPSQESNPSLEQNVDQAVDGEVPIKSKLMFQTSKRYVTKLAVLVLCRFAARFAGSVTVGNQRSDYQSTSRLRRNDLFYVGCNDASLYGMNQSYL